MVIVCDCKYRSSIPAIRGFSALGEEIIAVTTTDTPSPPAFKSRRITKKIVLPSDRDLYKTELLALCRSLDRPTIFATGVFTQNILAEHLEEFSSVADFCVASSQTLSNLNDKMWVKQFAAACGLAVPKAFDNAKSVTFPAIVKPHCGEKFGLKPSERYRIVHNSEELEKALSFFAPYDADPIMEEFVSGDGVGASFLLGKDKKARTAFLHRRLLEYPVDGGPSACLETFENSDLIHSAKHFLESAGFVGLGMVEFKESQGKYYVLEVNPRVWGSFPATAKASSNILKCYLEASKTEPHPFEPIYRANCRVKFSRGVLAAAVSYVKRKRFAAAFRTLGIFFNPCIKSALFSIKDPLPSISDFFRRS
ncbi:MAG: ATP-grasp domain-containing protein [Ruminococcaceae bacterium]|nr:ATP-grasp domain-containing protein [Oscillospiraceae bacterium]